MAVCMCMATGHEHGDACDARAADGRTTTVIAVRIPDVTARQLRAIMTNPRTGYGSVSEYINFILDTQVLRKR